MSNNVYAPTEMILNDVFRYLSTEDSAIEKWKIALYPYDMLTRTIIHAIIRSFYCRLIGCTPGVHSHSPSHRCNNETTDPNIPCGYIIGQAIFRWYTKHTNPALLNGDNSLGCSFYHDRKAAVTFTQKVIEMLENGISSPLDDPCNNGFKRIIAYVMRVHANVGLSSSYWGDDNIPKSDMPDFRRIPVYSLKPTEFNLKGNPMSFIKDVILTNDNIFDLTNVEEDTEEEEEEEAHEPINDEHDDYFDNNEKFPALGSLPLR